VSVPERCAVKVASAARTSSSPRAEIPSTRPALGPWTAHPANPVRSDARRARPAGALFAHDGALFRPAQICVPRYGAGLSINRVLRLTPHSYAERQVERVLPDAAQGLLGLHTMNRAGDLTVADAFTRRRRIAGAP